MMYHINQSIQQHHTQHIMSQQSQQPPRQETLLQEFTLPSIDIPTKGTYVCSLKKFCKSVGIRGFSKLKKKQLLEKVEEYRDMSFIDKLECYVSTFKVSHLKRIIKNHNVLSDTKSALKKPKCIQMIKTALALYIKNNPTQPEPMFVPDTDDEKTDVIIPIDIKSKPIQCKEDDSKSENKKVPCPDVINEFKENEPVELQIEEKPSPLIPWVLELEPDADDDNPNQLTHIEISAA